MRSVRTHSRVAMAKESAKNGLAKNNKVTLIFFLLPRYFFSGFFSKRSFFFSSLFYFYFIFLLFNLTQFSVSWLRALARSLHSAACQTDKLHTLQSRMQATAWNWIALWCNTQFYLSFLGFSPFLRLFARFTLSRRLSGHQRLKSSKIQGLWRMSMQFLHACHATTALTVDCHCHIPHVAPACLSPCQAVCCTKTASRTKLVSV